jgi:transposase
VIVERADRSRPSYDQLVAALAERDARIARQVVLIGGGRAKDALIAELRERIAAQDAKIAALERLVAQLAAKVGRDSQNSSKPPGSDGPGTRSERRRAQREGRKCEPAECEGGEETRRAGRPCRTWAGVFGES